MKERLIVYLRGARIGFIEFDHDANSREFSYDAEYLASSGACPISLSLPLREKPFNSWETRLFFENLLPPVVVRRRLEKIIHHDADNYFAFLKTLGGDCAGAIALYPEDIDPAKHEDVLRELSDDEADEILPQKADVLAVEMSDEGHPSPIYARIGEVIRGQIAQVKGAK